MLIALRLKDPLCLGQLRDQPNRNTLGLQPSGYHGSKIGSEGADLQTRLVMLLNGLVMLLAGCAKLRAESLCSPAQLVSLLAQLSYRLSI